MTGPSFGPARVKEFTSQNPLCNLRPAGSRRRPASCELRCDRRRCRRPIVQRRTWTPGVVLHPPLLDHDLRLLRRIENLSVQAFVSQLPVKTFHVRVLHRLARFDVYQLDFPLQAPVQKIPGGESGAVLTANRLRCAPLDETASSTRVTRRLPMLLSTSSARHSRVYGSTTLSARNFLPLSAASCTKSSAHS